LNRHLPPEYFTCPEGEFSLSDDNSVVPDFVVVRSSDPLIYARENRRPKTSDIALVIEIAVSSLAKDLGPDLRRYAQANIPASWVADLVGRRILAHTEPQVIDGLPGYAQVLTVTAGQILPLILDDREVAQIPYELLMP
jgi:Uma2 family endonuclease